MEPARPHRTTRRGDRGITAVFFAISVTSLLAVGGLVLGGSTGYTAVRSAQTAADAAALAGTSTLRDHQQNWIDTPATAVLAEVQSVVEDNGAALAPGGCTLLRAGYALTKSEADTEGPCSELPNLTPERFRRVAGVRVAVTDTRDVPFSAFVDSDTITASATAAATAQPISRGRSPFMVCTSPNAVGHPATALLPDASDPTGYSINPAAVGKLFVLWGNQIKNLGRDCGNGSSSWRGLVQYHTDFALPSPTLLNDADWWGTEDGNKSGITGAGLPRTLASGSCSLGSGATIAYLVPGCRVPVPLCPTSNNRNDSQFKLYCVKIGVFEITKVSIGSTSESFANETDDPTPCTKEKNNIVCGRLIGGATASAGQGIAQNPDANGVVVVKLVQ